MKLTEVRNSFLKFYESKRHTIVKSSPLIPQNDPTLMFVNAGMVQFKNYFTGAETPKFTRAVTTQKCVRAGGKHNDLDNVGYTARHHTFFEMLGNFSFGDYFKKDAIQYAWEFLTKVLGLSEEKLVVTIYHTDDEAFKIWNEQIGVPADRIIRIDTKDNFWEMGNTGPCGPCSEIFYDHGPDVWGGRPGTPEEDGDRYIEIWNLVFMQYERLENGNLRELPKPCIDTGSGLERLVAVLQGKHNNYETDLFIDLIQFIENTLNVKGDTDEKLTSLRVISDHLRSCSFLIADGVTPSNEGRGYVLRRIMRRAMRYINQLGVRESAMYKLVPELSRLMGNAYPELFRAQELIMDTLKAEEDRFRRTLDKGLKLLEEATVSFKKGDVLNGDVAFKLYDTYGFPLDLTQDILRRREMSVDLDGFDKAMEEQKQKARKAWAGSGEAATSGIYLKIKDKLNQEIEFLGYDSTTGQGQILALLVDGKEVQEANKGDKVEVVTDRTPFYGESGGQVGDTGLAIKSSKDGSVPLPFSILQIKDTQKPVKGLTVHKGEIEFGTLKVGEYLNLTADSVRRKKVIANHSAAHLIHFALRQIIGDSLTQKGSYVSEERMRFDVSCQRPITKIELHRAEEIVNAIIAENHEVCTKLMDVEDASESGAMALFGEKYDEKVRVVSMGQKYDYERFIEDKEAKTQSFDTADNSPENMTRMLTAGLGGSSKKKNVSVELCGGTHVKRTGDIGLFKIVSESALAAGVRRIEAVTGLEALKYVNKKIGCLDTVADELQVSTKDTPNRVIHLKEEIKALKKEIQKLNKANLSSVKFTEEEINGIKLVTHLFKGFDVKDVKTLALEMQNKADYKDNAVIVFIAENEGKVTAMAGVSKNITDKYKAPDLVRKSVELLGGQGGGGQPHFAMGGGKDTSRANEVFEMVKGEL